MKTFFKIIFTVAVLYIPMQMNGQGGIWPMGGLHLMNYLDNAPDANLHYGLNLKCGYGFTSRTITYLGVKGYIPTKSNYLVEGTALDVNVIPQQIEVAGSINSLNVEIDLGTRYYIASEPTFDFATFSFVELAYMIYSTKYEVGTVADSPVYILDITDGTSESLSGFRVNVGLGAEKMIGFGQLFAEVMLGVPISSASSTESEINVPSNVAFTLGIKLPLGNQLRSYSSLLREFDEPDKIRY